MKPQKPSCFVGQVNNLRRIANPPSGITCKCLRAFAACCFAGRVGNLRAIGNRPALWGSQSWLQAAFSRLLRQHARQESSIAHVNALRVTTQ